MDALEKAYSNVLEHKLVYTGYYNDQKSSKIKLSQKN
jgi:hypothetical protein